MPALFKHVLVATDGSVLADKAIQLALHVAGDAPVTALLVVADYGVAEFARATFGSGPGIDGIRPRMVAAGERRLAEVVERVGGQARRMAQRVMVSDQIYRAILDTAEHEACDLVVVASHGHGGFTPAVLGSQTLKVISLARQPVLVAR